MEPLNAGLLARACDGDHAALTTLLKTHTPTLAATVRSQIPDRWQSLLAVEDVLQETFTDAYLSIGKFVSRGDGAFVAWLRKLAQNNLLEGLRALEADKRGGGRRPISFEPGADAHTSLLNALAPAATQTTPSQHVTREETRITLDAALGELPAHYRRAVRLYDLEGRTIDETAAELGCSPGGVHLIRHRAFKQLRALLAGRAGLSRPSA